MDINFLEMFRGRVSYEYGFFAAFYGYDDIARAKVEQPKTTTFRSFTHNVKYLEK